MMFNVMKMKLKERPDEVGSPKGLKGNRTWKAEVAEACDESWRGNYTLEFSTQTFAPLSRLTQSLSVHAMYSTVRSSSVLLLGSANFDFWRLHPLYRIWP